MERGLSRAGRLQGPLSEGRGPGCRQRIYDAIWDNFSGPIRVLLHNKYVFAPFWKHHNGVEGFGDWEEWFRASERRFRRALEERDTVRVLRFVFDRLYLLRNQIVHGGATWNSRVNRDQVRDGTAILAFLMPVFVDFMMDHPPEDWESPFYPIVEWGRASMTSMPRGRSGAACRARCERCPSQPETVGVGHHASGLQIVVPGMRSGS